MAIAQKLETDPYHSRVVLGLCRDNGKEHGNYHMLKKKKKELHWLGAP